MNNYKRKNQVKLNLVLKIFSLHLYKNLLNHQLFQVKINKSTSKKIYQNQIIICNKNQVVNS